jgi:hypothetical protein
MHCSNCNSEIPEEAKFCPKCGFNLKNITQQAGNVIISPEINVSPVISVGGEGAQVKMDTHKLEERIKNLENGIKRISTVESRDLRQLEAKYGKEDLVRILESFRILQRIKEMTNEDHKASEYVEQLNLLEGYTEGFDKRFIDDLDNILRRINAELLPGEFVPDESRSEIRRICLNEIDVWVAEFLKG